MKQYISISEYPGKTGMFYYNKSFEILGLDSSYTAIKADISNFNKILENALNENISGISISMPFKKLVIPYLNDIDYLVEDYGLCNTILCSNNKLTGYNCDYYGLESVSKQIPKNDSIKILGNGCIGSMVYKYLFKTNKIKIYSRSLMNWEQRHEPADIVINCTSVGTLPGTPLDDLNNVKLVLDYCIGAKNLPDLCKESNIDYIGGIEFYKYQFLNQFKIYTNIELTPSFFDHLSRINL